MKLSFLLDENSIKPGISGGERSRREIITELLNTLYDNTELKNEGVSRETLIDEILLRERDMTTGLGMGIAFPHARVEKLSNAYNLLGICPTGVDFQSLDHLPTFFFVLTIVPRDKTNLLLLNRAGIVRFLSNDENRQAALAAKDASALWQVIDDSGISIDRNILARDIMRPHVGHLSFDATLKDAARALHKYHCDSLPILDADGRFIRDISCYDIFSSGLPDFFANLHTISFVRNMDPFEKYFQSGRDFRLNEMTINRDSPTISVDATLMEIVFEIATHNKQMLYVVDKKNRLFGIIDRFSIVDKILVSA